jgi:hypothetical protein
MYRTVLTLVGTGTYQAVVSKQSDASGGSDFYPKAKNTF